MDIVTIDFETYYDKAYSLSKMTTENYIRDPRFELIGVGVKVNDYPTDWYSGENFGGFLKGLDYRDKAILAHNTMFDGAILSWKFGINPKLWLDTLSMSRPFNRVLTGGSLAKLAEYYGLGAKGDEVVNAIGMRRDDFDATAMARYASYCVNDVELTYQLFKLLSKKLPPSEWKVIDRTIRMYTEPRLELDRDLLEKHLTDVKAGKAALVDAADGMDKGTLQSADMFANALAALGVDPPVKTSKTTGKQTYAFSKTDKEFTDLLEHSNPTVAALVAARLGVKSTIEETRTERLLGVAQRGSLPVMLNYYGAHTGRFSGGEKLNLQNLPRGGTLRKALVAPEGHLIIACDSSQIEARTLAWLAGQEDLVEAFRNKRDVYSEFASKVYGRTVTKADKEERHVGKTSILGLGYGMGAVKFRGTLALGMGGPKIFVDEAEAQRVVKLYRTDNVMISALWNQCSMVLPDMCEGGSGMIGDTCISYDGPSLLLPNGMRIDYTELKPGSVSGYRYIGDQITYRAYKSCVAKGEPTDHLRWINIYGGKMVENIVQALARIIVADQLVTISTRYPVVLQIHDEVVIVAKEEEAEEAQKFMEEVMSTPPVWAADLPLACEAGRAKTYGDT